MESEGIVTQDWAAPTKIVHVVNTSYYQQVDHYHLLISSQLRLVDKSSHVRMCMYSELQVYVAVSPLL